MNMTITSWALAYAKLLTLSRYIRKLDEPLRKWHGNVEPGPIVNYVATISGSFMRTGRGNGPEEMPGPGPIFVGILLNSTTSLLQIVRCRLKRQ